MQLFTRPWNSPRFRPSAAAALVAFAFAGAPCQAADPAQEAPAAPPARETAAPAKEPVCVHGCERWGKFCNVDPRGVYKCRRRCEKFGEICE